MAVHAAIPQPRPLPLIGNLRDIDMAKPIQSFARLAALHGPIYRLTLGGTPVTILSSRELIDEVCDETRFSKKVYRSLTKVRRFGGDGLFTAYNDEPNWGKAHRLLMPAFGPIGIRAMFDRMYDIADQMLIRWERFGEDLSFDVADNMTRLALDTIALCAFDYRFNSFYRDEMHPFLNAIGSALQEAGSQARRPEIATKMMVRRRRRFDADVALISEVADAVIAERRRNPDADVKDDLLARMLQGRDPETGEGLSDENIRFQMVTFLIAGHETTSGMLSFTLFLLLRNPEVLARARAAVDEALGSAPPRVEDLARLRFIEQILMEALRLYPTVPGFAVSPHVETTIGGGYAVTPRDTLLVLTYNLHRDPAVWGAEAAAFRPDRFDPDAAAKLPPNAWKPFGNGARACIGRGFAMQEAQIVLTMILQRFDLLDPEPGYALQIAETMSIKPQGFRLRVRRREDRAIRPHAAPSPPAAEAQPRPLPAAAPAQEAIPLRILYGSNTGSCEAFARRIAAAAVAQGYSAEAAAMDHHVARLRQDGALIVITASYEGRPPDNGRLFLPWLEGLPAGALDGLRYAVFGCGNRQWARTYQAIPKRTDTALERAGGARFHARGEADAGGDFFGGFDAWCEDLWTALGTAFGRDPAGPAPDAEIEVEVEVRHSARPEALRLGDLERGRVIENRELVDMTSGLARSKRHIEIALPKGMTYRVGDYLAILPRNPQQDVERALRRFGLAGDAEVVIRGRAGEAASLPLDRPVAIGEVLASYVELGQPATRTQVGQLARATRGRPEQVALEALSQPAAYEAEVLGRRLSLVDLLDMHPACELPLGAFLAALPAMRSRQYSISSSPLRDPGRLSLTVAILDEPAMSGHRRHLGVASTFLAGLEPGTSISVAVRPSQSLFRPPSDPATPIVMVCAGSGIAPFHGFLQERAILRAEGREVGPALLLFGGSHPDADYLYRDQLAAWQADGLVEVQTAFSRYPDGEVKYVQHRLWTARAAVTDLVRQGATFYVCGDGARMAPAVRETFVRIHQDATGVTFDAAEEWAERMERETGRYVADVFV